MSLNARKIRLIMALRRAGISDTRVLAAIERVPREVFVPDAFADKAYEDTALPIGHGQTISQPLVVARMLEVLEIGPRHTVLEIGAGSGYQTAILSHLARRVYGIELVRPLKAEAERRLRSLSAHNTALRVTDGRKGWPEAAPFSRIVVAAAAFGTPPQPLIDQLSEDGILVLPIKQGPGEAMIHRITRQGSRITEEVLWPARFVPLVGGEVHAVPPAVAWNASRQVARVGG